MSTIDKRIYIDTLRQRLGDIVTANDMERVLKVADDVLIDFDVRAIGQKGEDIDSEQLLDFYLMQCEVRGFAQGTLYGYRRKLKRLLESSGTPFKKMRSEHIMEYMRKEKARGISTVSMDNDRHTFSAFFTWMIKEEVITRNPMDRIPPFRKPTLIRIPFSDTELRLIDEAAKSTRDKALIASLTATGCRAGEASAIDR